MNWFSFCRTSSPKNKYPGNLLSPARQRRIVVFPHPDGPSKTKKSPFFISKLIPDLQYRGSDDTANTVNFVIKGRNYPLESLSTLQTVAVTPNSTFTNTRARSRQSAIRIENTADNFGWRLGDLRLEIRPDGKR